MVELVVDLNFELGSLARGIRVREGIEKTDDRGRFSIGTTGHNGRVLPAAKL